MKKPEKKESKHIDCWEFDSTYCFKHQECVGEDEMHPLKMQGYNQACDDHTEWAKSLRLSEEEVNMAINKELDRQLIENPNCITNYHQIAKAIIALQGDKK